MSKKNNWILIVLFIPLISCSQGSNKSFFQEADYIELKRGSEEEYPYVIVYVNRLDNNYKLKKNFFFDSTYMGNTYAKTYYFKDVAEGPFESIIHGQLSQKGAFKNGKYDGERLHFTEGKLTQKAYFKDGKKSGVWEQYDENGKLITRIKYDQNGNIVKEEKLE